MQQTALGVLAAIISHQLPPQVIPSKQWPNIIRSAEQHGLAPMLFWLIKQSGVETSDGLHWQTLATLARQSAMEHVLREIAQTQIQAALAAASIPALWLKGSALARMIYPDPTLRPMGDLDVLVPLNQREHALQALQAIGYRLNPEKSKLFPDDHAITRTIGHDTPLIGGLGDRMYVELHYCLASGSGAVLSPEQMEWFWQRSTPFGMINTLTAEAHLLFLCAHAELQHGGEFRLLRYLDLHLLITQTPIIWEEVIEQAAVLRWTMPVARALITSVRFFDTPLPIGLLDTLNTHRPIDENIEAGSSITRRKWEYLQGAMKVISPTQRWRLLWRVIAPTPDYMRLKYGIPIERSVWPYYLVRWRLQIGEILGAIRGKRKPNR